METQLEKILNSAVSEYSELLRKYAADPGTAQEKSLFDILSLAGESEIGKKYGFSDIRSIREYQEKIPILDYDDYKPYINRIYEGEENILFPGKPVNLVFTSGTTGDAKTFPESELGDRLKRSINRMRSLEIERILTGKRTGSYHLFTITNTASYEINKAGIPIGSASGLALMQSSYASKKLSVPRDFTKVGYLTAEDQNYCFAYFALRDKMVQELVCNNPAHFINILEVINSMTKELLKDIESGTISVEFKDEDRNAIMSGITPDPERARELREIYERNGELKVGDFWPEFVCLGCWLSASVGRIAKEYKDVFPKGTEFIHWGYGASESKFDVPVEPFSPAGIPVVFGTFLEFKDPVSGSIKTIADADNEVLYELIITTYSGLYRYNLHDLVKIHEGADGLPRIEFICKSKDKAVINGKTLYSGELSEIIEKYEKEKSLMIRLFQGKVTEDGLELFVEPIGELDISDLKDFLIGELDKKGITLSTLTEYPQGYRNSLYRKVVRGKSISSTKLPVFI